MAGRTSTSFRSLKSQSRAGWCSAASTRDKLETLAGGAISTLGDAIDDIDAVVELELLLVEERGGERMFIPNPSPMPAWERAGAQGNTERDGAPLVGYASELGY
jgi:hypothetical protein